MVSTSETARPGSPAETTRIAGLDFHPLSEGQVVTWVLQDLSRGQGGLLVPVNVDVCRQVNHDRDARDLVAAASLVVADGMPLVWAARLCGRPLPERVTGSSLIFALSAAAAANGRSIYLLGGEPGVPERAGTRLSHRFPGLRVGGTDAPPVGFDRRPEDLTAVRARVAQARPDIVFVGLGFPKQERVMSVIAAEMPATWFVACGAAIPFAAGALRRAPGWMQRSGLEWVYRLISEPRRLFRRYLVQGLPFAVRLLMTSAAARWTP